MRIRLLTALTVFLSLTLTALADERVVDKEHGFSIQPASGWTRTETPGNMPYCFLKLSKAGEKDMLKLYVDQFEPDKPNLTLDQYVGGMKNFVARDMGGQVLSDSPTTVSGRPARKLIYTGKSVGFTDRLDKYLRIVVQGNNGKFFVVHGVANPDEFDKHSEEIESMASSFELGSR